MSLKPLWAQLLSEVEANGDADTSVDREKERAKQQKEKLDQTVHTDENRAKLADFLKAQAAEDEKWRAGQDRKSKGLKPLPPVKSMKT